MDKLEKIHKLEEKIAILKSEIASEIPTEFGKVYQQEVTDRWAMYQGDCVEVMKGIPANSIHYSIFSPPFLSLYVYSDMIEDMGNSKNDSEFYEHFSYFVHELYRVIMEGRLVSVHCSVVPMTITNEGVIGLKDFPGMVTRIFEKFGFIFHSKVSVWKDPLVQATRTKALGLAHKQIVKDSSRCNQGFADEILTFRKPGINPEPVKHPEGFKNYVGQNPEPKAPFNPDQKKNKYSHHVWQRYASPVWMDVNQTNTLNYRAGREANDERHICPLQLDLIARCVHLWTNPNDTVFSPFTGIGSEGFETIIANRKFIGIELKQSYYKQAIKNLQKAEKRGITLNL